MAEIEKIHGYDPETVDAVEGHSQNDHEFCCYNQRPLEPTQCFVEDFRPPTGIVDGDEMRNQVNSQGDSCQPMEEPEYANGIELGQ